MRTANSILPPSGGVGNAAPRLLLQVLALSVLGPPLAADDAFVDVSRRAQLDGVHVNGAQGLKYLHETMCGGAGWIDHDGDGLIDLYLVQGHSDPKNSSAPGKEKNRLYRNRGDGTFEDVTDRAGVGDRGFGFGLAVGDFDNDGDSDLYVTNFGPNVLYRNNGDGTFTDITQAAGVECPLWSTSAAFADFDGDGLLDLYVANYLAYDTRIHGGCTGNLKKLRSYCHPNKFDGAPDSLFINRGDGRFADISRSAGVAVTGRIRSKGLGVLPTDFDLDGDIDILVANDSVPNFLWRNLGGGRFEDAALEAGVSLNSDGDSEACMGVDGGDVDGDGRIDYYVTNFSRETDTLYLNEGDGFFQDATYRARLAEPTYVPLGFGTRLIDFDLDGDLDIYVARGHVLDNVEVLNPGTELRYAQSDALFENDGKGHFTDVSERSGAWFREKLVGRAAAFADYDSDGDLDIFVVNVGARCALLENRAADRKTHHWLGLDLIGGGPANRDAYGARVTVTTPRGTVPLEVRSAASYLAANDSRLLVGLGPSNRPVPRVEVRWPDGLVEVFEGLAPDRYHTLQRGTGKATGGR
ncbi:MAG: CRTAC1 family protein [Planctomycetota bacterium]|nr:CRTAC1 family protein [Planctomycetota bacterium]